MKTLGQHMRREWKVCEHLRGPWASHLGGAVLEPPWGSRGVPERGPFEAHKWFSICFTTKMKTCAIMEREARKVQEQKYTGDRIDHVIVNEDGEQ